MVFSPITIVLFILFILISIIILGGCFIINALGWIFTGKIFINYYDYDKDDDGLY